VSTSTDIIFRHTPLLLILIAILHSRMTCPLQTFECGRANLGRAAGRDLETLAVFSRAHGPTNVFQRTPLFGIDRELLAVFS
jgi:hypothetical protein